jgi:hypothetical protein
MKSCVDGHFYIPCKFPYAELETFQLIVKGVNKD